MANSEVTEFLANDASNGGGQRSKSATSQPQQQQQPSSQSRARWKLLSNAVKSKQFQRPLENGHHLSSSSSSSSVSSSHPQTPEPLDHSSQDSLLRVSPFDQSPQCLVQAYNLMTYEPLECDQPWIKCRWNVDFLPADSTVLQFKFVANTFTVQDLAGFDNSGNVRLWPCEELLAYLAHGPLRHRLHGTRICELGAGMTALAGLVIAGLDLTSELYLTDGNDRCVANIREVVDRNFPTKTIRVQRLRWESPVDYRPLERRMESIICADCLFVRRHHRDLLETLDRLLVTTNNTLESSSSSSPIGTAYILAPKRGKTMREFVDLVHRDARFHLWEYEHFDPRFSEWYRAGQPATTEVPYLLVMRRAGAPAFSL